MTSPRQTARRFTHSTTLGRDWALPYWCYVPERHDSASLPLLLFLHGAGERGDDLESVLKHGPPAMLAAGESLPFVVISPQCPRGCWWSQRECLACLEALIQELRQQYPIDPRRIFGTGLSMGGYGIWNLAAMFPDLLAAIIPVCGGGDPQQAERLMPVRVWAFHGADDEIVPLVRGQEMVTAVNAAGGDARLTIYDNVAHDSWTATYANPAIYKWLLDDPAENRKA